MRPLKQQLLPVFGVVHLERIGHCGVQFESVLQTLMPLARVAHNIGGVHKALGLGGIS
jgi:hypothetical protein